MNVDLTRGPAGTDAAGKPVYLKDIWPAQEEVNELMRKYVTSTQFKRSYANVFAGPNQWQKIQVPTGDLYKWDKEIDLHQGASFLRRDGSAARRL